MGRKIAIGITGASGAVYARALLQDLEKLADAKDQLALMVSDNARQVWEWELGEAPKFSSRFTLYEKKDFMAPMASGSAGYDTLIICPCSMGSMGRIASGISDDLLTRSADVMLKERGRLILVVRDTPYNHIHLENMERLSRAGAIICPASPSFYSRPANFDALARTVTHRVLSLAGFDPKGFRWGG